MLKNHDNPTEIEEVYSCNFMPIEQLEGAGVDQYDIDILKPIIKTLQDKMKAEQIFSIL
jgi:hypothetical protein